MGQFQDMFERMRQQYGANPDFVGKIDIPVGKIDVVRGAVQAARADTVRSTQEKTQILASLFGLSENVALTALATL